MFGYTVTYPIGSMYAIYGDIYHQYTPNVSIYTSTMDPMGITSLEILAPSPGFQSTHLIDGFLASTDGD